MRTLRTATVQRRLAGTGAVSILLAAFATAASAQTEPDWKHGTTLAGFVGAASVSSDTDAAAGLSIGWEVTPRFAVEGRGIWLRAGVGQEAFAATLSGRGAWRPGEVFVPFAAAGVGLHYARFDSEATVIPDFYRERMSALGLPHAFTDFALSFGGGADVFLTPHLSLRPEVMVLLAMTTSDARATTIYGVQLAYHFEDHIIRARRR